jgi:hypothetical protein
MDIEACYTEIRDLVSRGLAGEQIDYYRVAELLQAGDEWLSSGGFLPHAWQTVHRT